MLNLCGIVVAILKMATARNFSISGIKLGHHNLPTHEMSLKSDNVEFVWYCGGHFENGDGARNFSMSGIYSGHHNLPTYEMSLKLDNVEFVRHCGGHFENGDR
jgi:5-carboxymethyl-2-hydroxymuconate isomerase